MQRCFALPPPIQAGSVLTGKLPVSRVVAYSIAIFIILVLLAIAIPDFKRTHGKRPAEYRWDDQNREVSYTKHGTVDNQTGR